MKTPTISELQSHLHDAKLQLARDSKTIARLARERDKAQTELEQLRNSLKERVPLA